MAFPLVVLGEVLKEVTSQAEAAEPPHEGLRRMKNIPKGAAPPALACYKMGHNNGVLHAFLHEAKVRSLEVAPCAPRASAPLLSPSATAKRGVKLSPAAAEVALSTAAVLRCQWELQEKREPPLH